MTTTKDLRIADQHLNARTPEHEAEIPTTRKLFSVLREQLKVFSLVNAIRFVA
jgi:hypothetical protein